MIDYNPTIEQFVDGVDFDPSKPCVWVVYPPGGAGDLLASIINFHYVETGAKFRGISSSGQVIFKPSDQKYSNQLANQGLLKFDDQFFFKIADILSSVNLNWSRMDQFIFSNHCYPDASIKIILDTFENCKIIRLLPKTVYEHKIITWLSNFKNKNIISDVPTVEIDTAMNWNSCNDKRVHTVYFGDFIHPLKFESFYQSIQTHLGVPGSLVSYNFVQHWLDKQDTRIRDCLVRLTSN